MTPNNSVVISRSTAEKVWRGQANPLRHNTLALTVVGVVADVTQDDWRQPGEAIVYPVQCISPNDDRRPFPAGEFPLALRWKTALHWPQKRVSFVAEHVYANG